MSELLGEKCAVFGIVGEDPAFSEAAYFAYEALLRMQHRGTEGTGIAVNNVETGALLFNKEPGLVRDAYNGEILNNLVGGVAIGHNRYSTQTRGSEQHIQPYINRMTGFAYGHNGNLPETSFLDSYLEKHIVNLGIFNDSERMGIAITLEILDGRDLPDAVELAYPRFKGAYSSVAMHKGSVVAFRDKKGIRPLAYGKFPGGFAVASETTALDSIGAEYSREVRPGEMLIMNRDGVESKQLVEGEERLDIFEMVYFARGDSYLYGQRVHEVRKRFGAELAEQHPPPFGEKENILVMAVPDTSVPAAEGYAKALGGIEQCKAIEKDRYGGRSFMQGSNEARLLLNRRKHSIISEVVQGRDIVVIDDSIVRLNTAPKIVKDLRRAGAKTVTFLVASPPVLFPDFYGIDTPSQPELAAANMSLEEMQSAIGCDYLGFLSISRMVNATKSPASRFTLSCFNGDYPIDIGNHKKELYTPKMIVEE